ncbi:hypothetical protein EVAR_19438_1 [Eumeta japonica]|uniref:Uncharacterized protein n=1 Tax=Eumeta variegata TaxID=151549 RepID=A0A4C1TRP7_EUMVA|nr:hypothetical protein EVAR_19438_1 [Eumeta japonica]
MIAGEESFSSGGHELDVGTNDLSLDGLNTSSESEVRLALDVEVASYLLIVVSDLELSVQISEIHLSQQAGQDLEINLLNKPFLGEYLGGRRRRVWILNEDTCWYCSSGGGWGIAVRRGGRGGTTASCLFG